MPNHPLTAAVLALSLATSAAAAPTRKTDPAPLCDALNRLLAAAAAKPTAFAGVKGPDGKGTLVPPGFESTVSYRGCFVESAVRSDIKATETTYRCYRQLSAAADGMMQQATLNGEVERCLGKPGTVAALGNRVTKTFVHSEVFPRTVAVSVEGERFAPGVARFDLTLRIVSRTNY